MVEAHYKKNKRQSWGTLEPVQVDESPHDGTGDHPHQRQGPAAGGKYKPTPRAGIVKEPSNAQPKSINHHPKKVESTATKRRGSTGASRGRAQVTANVNQQLPPSGDYARLGGCSWITSKK